MISPLQPAERRERFCSGTIVNACRNGIFSWRQSRDMKDAIAVAKETASAAMLQARAAVGVELPKIILSRVDLGDAAAASLASRLQSLKIEVAVTNYGKTPAFLLGQALEIEVCALLPAKPVYPSAFDLPPETVIDYKNKYPLGIARPKSPLSPEDIQAILTGVRASGSMGTFIIEISSAKPTWCAFAKCSCRQVPPAIALFSLTIIPPHIRKASKATFLPSGCPAFRAFEG